MEGDSLIERGRRIKLAAELRLAHSSGGRQWSRALRRRLLRCQGKAEKASEEVGAAAAEGGVEEDEEEEVERRVRTLQRLVPGGEEMAVDRLLEETADYIEALKGQVDAMRALTTFIDGLENERR